MKQEAQRELETKNMAIILDLHAVSEAVSLSEAQIKLLVRQDKFPKPRMLSERRVGWLTREVKEWAESRPVSELLPPPNAGIRKAG
jgi:prophage regulatory protein